MRLEGSKYSMKGKVLDEDTSMKIKQIEDHISKLDTNIADLQKKIKDCKASLKEGVESVDDLNELFGFGKKKDSPEDDAKRAELKRIDDVKYFAKVMIKNQNGTEIGKHLAEHPDDIKYFIQYIPKMPVEVVRDIIIYAPNMVGYFKNELSRLGAYYLNPIVQKHGYLKKVFDNMGLKY